MKDETRDAKILYIRHWLIKRMDELGDKKFLPPWGELMGYNDLIAELIYDWARKVEDNVMQIIKATVEQHGTKIDLREIMAISAIRTYAELNGFVLPDEWPFDIESLAKGVKRAKEI